METPVATTPQAARRKAGRGHAGWLETFFGRRTAAFVQAGKTDSQSYERFTVRVIEFGVQAGAPTIWNRARRLLGPRPARGTSAADGVVWLCFPGIDRTESRVAARTLGRLDLVPQEGTAFLFDGPGAIAGYSPEQCLRATARVRDEALAIVRRFPDRRIGVFSFSAGTHLGFYIANEIGRLRGRPVDKFIAVSPGESIAYGLYSTWVTDALATELEAAGLTNERYDSAIAAVTQKNNIEFLPSGRELVIHAGTADTYIPIAAEGGTDDLVARLRKFGKEPTYIVHEGLDHVTLAIKLMLLQKLGRDPYLLSQASPGNA